MSDSLRPRKLQHTKLPCSSLSPRVCSNSCPCPESVMPSNHLILCRLFLLLPSIFSSIRVFSNKSALCIRWPKYWSFSISLSSEYSGLISFSWLGLISLLSKRLSDYHLSPLGPSLSTSLLPLTAECLSRTCIQLKGAASLKVTMPL